MIDLLVSLLILVVIVALVWYVLNQFTLPAPFDRIARVVVVVIACLGLLYILLGAIGYGGHGIGLRRL